MLAALLLAAQTSSGAPPIDRSPRLRRTLPSGASIGAENRPGEPRVVFQAVLSNPAGDGAAEYGHRHLLEHLIAGRDPDLDRRLETLGGALGASTGREGMRFWISVPPEESDLGFEALRTLLRPITLTEEAIARERGILFREIALLTDEERSGRDAWTILYAESGLDPVGIEAALDDATPAGLERLWRGMLAGSRLSLFVAGPLELDPTVDRLERLARTFPAGTPAEWRPRAAALPAASLGSGTLALAVGPLDERETLAALATGLALASEVEGSAVTYTPSPRGGAILLQNTAAYAELAKIVRRGDTGLRNRALTLARAWLAARTRDAMASSEIRAVLAAYRPGLVPERLATVLADVREPELDAAFRRWQGAAQ